jgi:hypothetical protein
VRDSAREADLVGEARLRAGLANQIGAQQLHRDWIAE